MPLPLLSVIFNRNQGINVTQMHKSLVLRIIKRNNVINIGLQQYSTYVKCSRITEKMTKFIFGGHLEFVKIDRGQASRSHPYNIRNSHTKFHACITNWTIFSFIRSANTCNPYTTVCYSFSLLTLNHIHVHGELCHRHTVIVSILFIFIVQV